MDNEKKTVIKKPGAKRLRQVKSDDKRTGMTAPDKMMLLVTVVNREKTDFFIDLLSHFEINMQAVLAASGTADSNTLNLLGLSHSEKSVILSAVRQDKVKEALDALALRFKTVKGGKGIAYTIPMSSIIGVAIYQFLSNKNGGVR